MGNNESLKAARGDTRLAIKVGFWYVFTTFLTRGIAFITTPIFSRMMNKADYGEFSNYASWQATLLIVVSAELYNTLTRAYYDYKDNYDQYISSVTIGSCGLSVVFYLLFILSGKWIYNIVNIPPQYTHIMFFTLLCMSCRSIFLTRERTLYRYKSVALISVLGTLIPTMISVVLVSLASSPNKLSARVYGFYIPSSMVGLTCMMIMIFKGRTFKWEHIKYALKISLPLLVSYLTIYLLTSTNLIITKSLLGAEKTAIVSIATSVINILTILFHSVSGAITTWIMDNLEQNNYKKLYHEVFAFVAAISALSIFIILFAPEIVLILGGKAYSEAVILIPFLVLSVLLQTTSTVFTTILTYDKNVVKTAVYTGVVAVISIAVKVWLLPTFSLQVLSVINAVAFAVLFVVNYKLVRKAGYSQAINLKGYFIAIALAATFTFGSFFLYDHVLWRYVAIFVLSIIIAIKYKDVFRQLIGSKKKKSNPY